MQTGRSTLVAYVSFSSVDDQYVGNPSRGGRLRPHSGKSYTRLTVKLHAKKIGWGGGDCTLDSCVSTWNWSDKLLVHLSDPITFKFDNINKSDNKLRVWAELSILNFLDYIELV